MNQRDVMRMRSSIITHLLVLLVFVGCGSRTSENDTIKILNVSYDPTREFYQEFNREFTKYWKSTEGQNIEILMSHGGSGSQARAVIEGLNADVVTLALAQDVNAIHEQSGLLPADWQSLLPHNSAPYTSTIVFLVRKGNPKNISDWDDLIRDDVQVITPNPKTSGAARWNYLAMWGFALKQVLGDLSKIQMATTTNATTGNTTYGNTTYGNETYGNSSTTNATSGNETSGNATTDNVAFRIEMQSAEIHAAEFVSRVFRNVPVLDQAARAATNTFVQRGIGDVLINWENEILLAHERFGSEDFEIVVPSVSILAEPTVALIDRNVDQKGTRNIAQSYLEYLYSDVGQNLAAKHYYRPRSQAVLDRHTDTFAPIALFTIDDVFGGWTAANDKHFSPGGILDTIYK